MVKPQPHSLWQCCHDNLHGTQPAIPYYDGITPREYAVSINVTDNNLVSVNFTLVAPNETIIIDNVAGTM
jgi:hypothetical protein